jgi:hypothetical protein
MTVAQPIVAVPADQRAEIGPLPRALSIRVMVDLDRVALVDLFIDWDVLS